MLIGLALAMPQARADFRGKVHLLVNPEVPRAEWRRVPLPGAYVTVFWQITIPAPAHAITTCRYSEIARSDEKGEYVMEGPNFITAGLAYTSFLVHSPGLGRINFPYGGSDQSEKDITMARSTYAPHERLSSIAVFASLRCSDTKPNDPRGLLEAYYRGLLDEARSLQVDTDLGRKQFRGIEADIRGASGLDQPVPIRAVIKPPPGAIESSTPRPGQ